MRMVAALSLLLLASSAGSEELKVPAFSGEEKQKILAHGPWPPQLARDPGNSVSGKLEAVAFGDRLFFEPRLSGSGSVLCATCHVPHRAFQDGRPRALGLQEADRNTQSVLNVRFARRFGWEGAGASLWAQSIRPLLDAREMGSSAAQVAAFVRGNPAYAAGYEKAFSRKPPADDDALLLDVGKALAAFQETLVSGRTPFDEFRDALARNDRAAMDKYPAAARRGLKIFIGRGNCSACHSGPQFTSGELAGSGMPFFARKFRVPGLRNAALTAPYMHDGSLATLRDAVGSHSSLNPEEARDLVSFLETLADGAR